MTGLRYRIRAWLFVLPLALTSGALQAGGDGPAYDMNSWQSLIADDCRAFFDGCNQCRREPGKAAACTRMACAEYRKPRCLDDGQSSKGPVSGPTASYRCADGKTFSVTRDRYVQDDQVTQLDANQIMLRDPQAHTLYRLERSRSASGEKYVNAGGLEFFSKGDEAILLRAGEHLYRGCRIES